MNQITKLMIMGIILAASAAACAKAPTVEEAPLPSADETSTPLIEETPTEETGKLEEAETAESKTVERINAFLAGEGEYSDSALADKIFLCDIPGSEKDLGFIDYAPDQIAYVQGINLGVYSNSEKLVMMFGTKAIDGQRIVIPMYWDLTSFKYAKIPIAQMESRTYSWVDHDRSLDLSIDNQEDAISEIQKRLNEPLLMLLMFYDRSTLASEVIKNNGLNDFEGDSLMKKVENDRLFAYDLLKIVEKNYSGWDVGNEFNGKIEDFSLDIYSSPIDKLEIPQKENMIGLSSMVFRLEE